MLVLYSCCNTRWWTNNRSIIIKNVMHLSHHSAVREIQCWTQNAVRFRGYESRITKLNVHPCTRNCLFYLPDKCCVSLGYLLFLQFSLFDNSIRANRVDLSLSTSYFLFFFFPSQHNRRDTDWNKILSRALHIVNACSKESLKYFRC